VAARLNTSIDYIVTGKDQPDPLESRLLGGFRCLTVKDRHAVVEFIEKLVME